MRSLIFVAVIGTLAGTGAAAGERTAAVASGGAILVNSSFNAQIFVANETEQNIQEQETKLKLSMYERATRECELLRSSIVRSCRKTSISLSTQFNPPLATRRRFTSTPTSAWRSR